VRGATGGAGDPTDLEATLEAVEAGGIPLLAGGGRQEDARADQLELQAWRGGTGHLGEAGVDDVGRARERTRTEGRLLDPHALELVLGNAAQHLPGALLHGGDDDEVAEALEEVLDEAARVVAGLDDLVDLAEGGGAVAGRERVDGAVEQLAVGEAEQRHGAVVGQALGTRTGDELVEHRERVTHRAAARARHEAEHARLGRDVLRLEEALHVARELGRRDQAEGVVVRPRADGADDLLGLGRGEDELHVLGRLLDDLEQRVEALRRHHVRLVDDVDLETALGRAVARALAQVTRVVDATVAGRVDLDDVDRAGAAARERHARVARAARGRRRALLAVEAARQDARARRLAAAARAAEEVGVVDPAGAQRLHERLRHVLLADHVGEALGPVAAVQGGGHARNPNRLHRRRGRRRERRGDDAGDDAGNEAGCPRRPVLATTST